LPSVNQRPGGREFGVEVRRGEKSKPAPRRDARNVVEIGLSNAIDLAIRLGGLLLDFPEHPDEGRAQTNHDNQK